MTLSDDEREAIEAALFSWFHDDGDGDPCYSYAAPGHVEASREDGCPRCWETAHESHLGPAIEQIIAARLAAVTQ